MLSSYLWEDLGLLILASNGKDIEDSIYNFVLRYNMYKGQDLKVPEEIKPEILETQALYKIEGTSIEKVSDIEDTKSSYTPSTEYHQKGFAYRNITAEKRAKALIDLEILLEIEDYEELDVVFKAADIEEWWSTDPEKLNDIVALVDQYLGDVLKVQLDKTKLKTLTMLWDECKTLYILIKDENLTALDCYIGITLLLKEDKKVEALAKSFEVPYFFNPESRLEKIRNYLTAQIVEDSKDG